LEGVVDDAEGLLQPPLLEVVGGEVLEGLGVEEGGLAGGAAPLVGLDEVAQLVAARRVVEFVELEIEHALALRDGVGERPRGRRLPARRAAGQAYNTGGATGLQPPGRASRGGTPGRSLHCNEQAVGC